MLPDSHEVSSSRVPRILIQIKGHPYQTDAAITPKPMQIHWSMPTMYMMTKTTKTANSPPAKMKRYWAFSPLNSTLFPIPLLILYSITLVSMKWIKGKERRMACMCNDKEDTGSEPTGGGFARIGITWNWISRTPLHRQSNRPPHRLRKSTSFPDRSSWLPC